MTNEQVCDLARLILDANEAPDDVALAEVNAKLKAVTTEFGFTLVMVAVRVLSGHPYLIGSDNAENVQRSRELAEHLGATVTENVAPCNILIEPGQLTKH